MTLGENAQNEAATTPSGDTGNQVAVNNAMTVTPGGDGTIAPVEDEDDSLQASDDDDGETRNSQLKVVK